MAVKKHELVHNNGNQVDLSSLKQYIQLMNEQPNYLPPPNELVKHCQDIVKCLATRTQGDEDELWDLVQSIEEFLLRVMNSVHHSVKHEVVTAILDKFYTIISDPQSDASPVMSIVLVVLDESNNEATLASARWLVQQAENGPAGAGLRASLSCLYRWMSLWHGTPSLGNWIMAFIMALEENDYFEMLIEVSLVNLEKIFLVLDYPITLRQSMADVIFHILASLRESPDALDKVAPHVSSVLTNLAADSGRWCRQLLQTAVDILMAMVDKVRETTTKPEGADAFKAKYATMITCLEQHMASRGSIQLQLPPWRKRDVFPPALNSHIPMRKVGLLNLGNTCYMNSVVQALLVTRQFSTHVTLRMTAVPYWAKMGALFANMMHSITNKLKPEDFFTNFKPPFFSSDHQHDSSEFLGYVFELLQSYEHCSERNFDYTRTPVLTGASRLRAVNANGHSSSDSENGESSAGSSDAGSSSSHHSNKRTSDNEGAQQRKRVRHNEFLRRDSFIDNMFGGVLLTRLECVECHSSSLSRDVFRDLQLAYPEKPEGWQHNVQSLLEFYCSKERLSGDNRYQCRDCGGLRDAERSVLIEATPKYLILVLKNFKFEPKLQVQTKLMHKTYHNHTVTLPTGRSQTEHSTYTLYAAVIHAGTTLDSGHYYTLAKDKDQWHMYNDDLVSQSDESQLNGLNRTSTPYILFYKRTDIDDGAAPSMEELPAKLQESVMAHNKHCVETVRQLRSARP